MFNQLSFWQKIKLLITVTLLRYGIMKLRKYIVPIPLDDYKRKIFAQATWQFLSLKDKVDPMAESIQCLGVLYQPEGLVDGKPFVTAKGIKYKTAIDPSGQPRFLLDGVDDYCFRLKEEARITEPDTYPWLPLILEMEAKDNG